MVCCIVFWSFIFLSLVWADIYYLKTLLLVVFDGLSEICVMNSAAMPVVLAVEISHFVFDATHTHTQTRTPPHSHIHSHTHTHTHAHTHTQTASNATATGTRIQVPVSTARAT